MGMIVCDEKFARVRVVKRKVHASHRYAPHASPRDDEWRHTDECSTVAGNANERRAAIRTAVMPIPD
jgi:hypothetical protein